MRKITRAELANLTIAELHRERDIFKAEMERAAAIGNWSLYNELYDCGVQPIADELWDRGEW